MQAYRAKRHDKFLARAVAPVPDSVLRKTAMLTSEIVLAGPGGRPDRVVIDPVMAKPFAELEADLMGRIGIHSLLDGSLPQAVTTLFHGWIQELSCAEDALILLDDYGRIVTLRDAEGEAIGFAALLGDRLDAYHIRGMILDCDLSVDPEFRGHGLGQALVAAQLLYGEGLPTWEHDKPGYSPAGAMTVLRGLELAQRLSRDIETAMQDPSPEL